MALRGASAGREANADEIRNIVRLYKDDLYGYRRDVLGRAHEEWQQRVGKSVERHRRTSVSSGHGVGKTAFAADVIHWFLATRPQPAIVATANTGDQLSAKLWRELSKVNGAAKNGHWFEWKEKTFTMFDDPTQRAHALAWSKDNAEAFAGTHETHVLGVFDEGSKIDRPIWNTFSGAMSTDGARWLALGNPTRREGYFFDCTHGKLAARRGGDIERGYWNAFVIGSAESTRVSRQWLEEQKMLPGGIEGDEYRVRVLGLPPRNDVEQFISAELIADAMGREIAMFKRWPLILGCDVGRGDRSVVVARRGRVVLPNIKIMTGMRTVDFARQIVDEVRAYRDEHGLEANVVVEELGMGVGVVETIEDLGYADQVWGVNTGTSSAWPDLYANLRCEMWGETKAWLEDNVMLPNEEQLTDDLLTIKRLPTGVGKLQLETKEQMRRRGVRSPDVGDALALTFAMPHLADLLPERGDMWKDAWRGAPSTGATLGTWMGN